MQFKLDFEEVIHLQKIIFEKSRYRVILKQICENDTIVSLEKKVYFLNKAVQIKKEEKNFIYQLINKYYPNYSGDYQFDLNKKILILKGDN